MTVYSPRIDHLVIAALSLEEGARFVATKLGCEMAAGGAHPLMRTHNRLLGLWGGMYLEVIAVNPDAPHPETPRARLFSLDDPAMQKRLKSGPQLVHWVVSVERPKSLVRWQAQYPARLPPVVAMSRGTNQWALTVAEDGSFPVWQDAGDGLLPSLIQWESKLRPGMSLPETGIALKSLTGFHPRAHLISEQLAWLGATRLMNVEVTDGPPSLVAGFELPDGSIVTIGEAPKVQGIDSAPEACDDAKPARKRARSKKADVPLAADAEEKAAEASSANEG